mmetsp:Transcript_18696/g.25912  ORF Transcript_18696/g.25912 Transcript_18696/m.25912 type:complete len:201 (-) Transcript_18696:93-695(-)
MLRDGGKSTTVVSGGRKKIHTTFEEGSEMVEEYDEKTLELLVRKRRKKTTLGKESPWDFEVGMDAEALRPTTELGTMRESSLNPIFARKDSPQNFEWRVRNLHYPADTYDVSIDPSDRKIVIRTSNKKYYKRFNIPELDHLGAPVVDSHLQWRHNNNTLLITYKKPEEVVQAEKRTQMELKTAKTGPAESLAADENCKQQ